MISSHVICYYYGPELYDIIMESQQFESIEFDLNPVLRMAIMRKVLFGD